MVYFPFPDAAHRLQLWTKRLPQEMPLAEDVDLQKLVSIYELSGSNIVNVVQYGSLQWLAKKLEQLPLSLLLEGIRREYRKEEKRI